MKKLFLALACFGLCSFSHAQDSSKKKVHSHTDAHASAHVSKPYWHIERCRIGETRRVPVEVIVNGEVAWRREIEADGSLSALKVPLEIKESSWVAVRILPSIHTNPVWVTADDKPVRASKRSAEWCIKAVDQCWGQKGKGIRGAERATAKQAYAEAKSIYERILS